MIVDYISDRNEGDIPGDVLFMEYDGFATSQVYDAALTLMARTSDSSLPDGFQKFANWYRYLPRIRPQDADQIRREIENYAKVLVAA
jgi:hypothetical protein